MDRNQSNTSHPRKFNVEEELYAVDQNFLRMYAKSQIDSLKSDLPRLIESIVSEKVIKERKYVLPEFNPDISNNDPHTWCKLIDIHLSEQNLSGRELFVVISAALKGSALRWLSHLPYKWMTWPDLKKLFKSRYCFETPAAAIIKIRNSQPAEGVSLATYASEIATELTSTLEGLTTEQIVIAMVLSQISTYDERIQRIALTTDISSFVEMQREIEAVVLKRTQHDTTPREMKRIKLNTTTNDASQNFTDTIHDEETMVNVPAPQRVTCFKCWLEGHYESECPQSAGPSGNQGSTNGGMGAAASTSNQCGDDCIFISDSHQDGRVNYSPAPEDDSN
ncbi:uncharacterized protein LOC126780211 [Nymphalis io]|uniref:uncharacterized protein LOC126780211 n=1 Tax=Inachis io TaxID=171585 RepID=UPI0021686A5F|nr:uncharacterized protein LOC126780211 [Nymphalis io]